MFRFFKTSLVKIMFIFLCLITGLEANAQGRRATIKNSILSTVNFQQPKDLTFGEFYNIPGPKNEVLKNDPRYENQRLAPFLNPLNMSEGDPVMISGWANYIIRQKDNTYTIQIIANTISDGRCVIAAIPSDTSKLVQDEKLKPALHEARRIVEEQMLQKKELKIGQERSIVSTPVQVVGQLFYNTSFIMSETNKGKKDCTSRSIWEIHPVTFIKAN
ncbi:MAG: hypothetical protein K1X44_05835 [Alphaproteobacteria bacterium]|nr:hypothetical protein [Alphaproteobacteria bacterium]